ncbi:MAG: hypothetical protein HC882_02150 [Acidobacteria bacterium]|nr:hypothetical protein [Acidobacteriota bacterium]
MTAGSHPVSGKPTAGRRAFSARASRCRETHYGSILDQGVLEMWESPPCRAFRDGFEARVRAYDKELEERLFHMALGGFRRAKDDARRAMGPPPKGCESCHYLFGV